MKRRDFLQDLTYSGRSLAVPLYLSSCSGLFDEARPAKQYPADIVIVGGGLGGCAATLSASMQGASVITTEPADWIGGQVSQQGVPPDEHQWIESFGRTANYARFRTLISDFYRKNYRIFNRIL